MIRILILFSAAELGGAERSLTRMSLANADPRIAYRLGTIGGEGEWARWARSLGIDPLVWPCWTSTRRNLGSVLSLVHFLRRDRPQIVYAAGVRACSLVRLTRPLLGGVRIVHAIRSSFPEGSDMATRYARVERLLKSMTDGYIANSASGADSLARVAGIRRELICVIPNGIEVAGDAQPPLQQRPHAVAVVANLNPLKGHAQFLDVVQAVARAHAGSVFHFVGRDDMNGAIQRQVAARQLSDVIRFAGFQSDVSPFWAASRVCALPSQITEGAPTSILEAQAAGLPAVAYAVGGVPELIRDGIDGYLIANGDSASMARALVSLLRDADRAAAMGAAGRRKIEGGFSLEICAQRHAQTWHQLCAG